MALLSEQNAVPAEAITELCYTNPFTPRRIELERQALGPGFAHAQALWITTPSLAEQLRDAPDDLHAFVEYILDRMLGPEAVDDDDDDDWDRPQGALADEVVAFIRGLGPDYPWPGNVRELEQSVRSFVVKQDYKPMSARSARPPRDARAALGTTLRELDITASALVSQYCDALHDRLGSITEVAETTGLTRKTVAKRLSSLR